MIAWLLAFIAYKPAAAIIYAMAFRLLRDDGPTTDPTGIWANIAGVALMGMALVALPAMMRFLVPMISSQTGGGGAGTALITASHAMPTGSRGGSRPTAPPAQSPQASPPPPAPSGATSAAQAAAKAGAAGAAKTGAATGAAPVAIAAAASAIAGDAATKARRRVSDEVDNGPTASGE